MSQYVPIELDKVRNLRMGFRASSIIEKSFNKPMAKINFEELTIEEISTIIYAGLVHEDNSLTVDKVIDLLDEYGDLETVSESLGKAIELGFARKNV